MKKLTVLLVLIFTVVTVFSQPPNPPDVKNYYEWYAALAMALYMAGFGSKWLLIAWKNKRLANKK
jgi:hypothetical protein